MIDIHTHILPFIDDGSPNLEESEKMLVCAKQIGITDIVFTPHYRDNCKTSKEQIEKSFEAVKDIVQKVGINVYLGQEIKYYKGFADKILSGEHLTLNQTKCVLVEFDSFIEEDVSEVAYSLSAKGLIPIIAHLERYPYCLDFSIVEEIKNCGGLIQINAGAVIGKMGKKIKKFVLKLIKFGLVDFIASDVHSFRLNDMQQAYLLVQKKFGVQVAEDLFVKHQKIMILSKKFAKN